MYVVILLLSTAPALDFQKKTFSTKRKTRIGCWNVRAYTTGRRKTKTINDARRYEIEFLGVSEVRWEDSGEITSG